MSISSVRRLERDRLHPQRGPDGTHYFDPAEVTALATVLATERRPAKPIPPPPTPKLSAGEIAARAFECFEQRYSLAEVVIALRAEPKLVRELFHEWLVSLTQGELRRADVALPREETVRRVIEDELAQLLASLPSGEPTRVSVARFVTEYEVEGATYLEVVELGGFITHGPIALRDITRRYGISGFRVAAYGLAHQAMRWEVVLAEPPD
jgi:hypothetical protein